MDKEDILDLLEKLTHWIKFNSRNIIDTLGRNRVYLVMIPGSLK